MRVLLLSDIHANLEALEACLNAAPEYDAVANLGNLVGYNASPNEVIDRARELGDFFVRGNHDRACCGLSSLENFNPLAAMAGLWTRTMLTRENQRWLRHLPAGPESLKGLESASFVHSSPLREDDYILSMSDAVEPLRRFPVPVTFLGHTHVQGGFGLREGDPIVIHPAYLSGEGIATSPVELDRGARYLINPGSVGQPRDRDWRSAFAVFDSEAHRVTFYRVPYEVKRTQQRIRDADLPEQLAERLAVGR